MCTPDGVGRQFAYPGLSVDCDVGSPEGSVVAACGVADRYRACA
jgi:hypothetical protein